MLRFELIAPKCDESQLDGTHNRLGAIGDPELADYALDMDLGGRPTDYELFGDRQGAIIDMLNDDRAEYSLQALTQLQRVVLDTMKTLEAFHGVQYEPEGYMDEEWEQLLSTRPPAQEDPEG